MGGRCVGLLWGSNGNYIIHMNWLLEARGALKWVGAEWH